MNADISKLNGLAPRACELCEQKDVVQRCSACHAVYYCGRECQVKDRPVHKTPCNLIKKERARYQLEEKKLRGLPENLFANRVGYFWKIPETRQYMLARYEMVDALLLSYGTAGGPVDLVEAALDHLLDMLRLCRSDGMGMRSLVPALYIRLGRDQEAYDFVKWWATTAEKRDYDWANMGEPYLDVHGADVFEALIKKWTRTRFTDLSHLVAIMLTKVRVLLDLQAIQTARNTPDGQETAGQLVSVIATSRPEIIQATTEEIVELSNKLEMQTVELYGAIKAYNSQFWDLLVKDPDAGVLQRPNGGYALGTKEEALLALGYSYASWYETPGAVDMIRTLGGRKEKK